MNRFFHIPNTEAGRKKLIEELLQSLPKGVRLVALHLIVLVQEQERPSTPKNKRD